jgi:hypothetical protein
MRAGASGQEPAVRDQSLLILIFSDDGEEVDKNKEI